MLQALRDKTSGWIAIVIVAILAVPFAFFGMEQYLFQSSANYAAKVEAPPKWWRSAPAWWPASMVWDSEEVSAEDFRTAFEQARLQRRDAEGEAFDARGFETAQNRREVLEGLIDQAVIRLAARQAGVAVGDREVAEMIREFPAFQVDGRFDPERYQLALGSQNPPQTPASFQELVREGLQQGLIPTRIAESAFVTGTETERMLRLLGERRDVSLVVLPPPEADTAAVTAEEIQAWHQANAAQYRAPEMVTLEYLDLEASAVPPPAAPDEASLRQRYAQEQSRFVDPEQRLASHILVRVDAGADDAADQAARQKAAELAGQARGGADFAALAREHSDDTGSQAGGGDLGWVAQDGTMVKPFEDALFALQPGEVSEPVKTPFGWHVLQLREVREGRQVPFEDVRDELLAEQAEADRERSFNEYVGGIIDEVYKNPTSLESAAELAGQRVRTVGPFARGEGTGIAAIPAVVRAAFSESLVQDGTVSDPIEVSPTRSVLVRVSQHTPERALSANEARDEIVAAIRADRAAKRIEADAEAMLARIRAGESLQAVAGERGLEVQSIPGVPRGAPIPDPAAAQAMFRVPAPEGGVPVPGKAPLPDGGMLVFTVDSVAPGDPAEASEQERTMFRQQMSSLMGNEDADSLLKALRRAMKITVVEARL
ncbi:peptidylprolyl isomerase [Luteimonas aestuarii]|uniref:Periplasmic chaperone PpiD n=1 Tax=Luteimonas aestuarii TaxID=453837 RepID=A0A4R5U4N8_9GAMM|nr:peptidyl-prolyl cis-trans isomerase [Luteimonas aestuarii]TDK28720.1 peptidylprolyl isomerase [Luteimonas aestuarii]